jgi:phosphomannomutase/phosphoglucomutase
MKKPEFKSGATAMVMPAVGAVLLLAGAWMAWSGMQVQSANRLSEAADKARTEVADAVRPGLKAALDHLDKARERAALATALQRGDTDGAKALVGEGWKEAEAIELIAPDLTTAYADPASFGFGKLGVLEHSISEQRAVLAVIKDGKPSIGLAAPVVAQGETLGLIYVRQPLAPFTQPVDGAAPDGGYVALRQGNYTVAESGDAKGMGIDVESGAVQIDGTPLRVVAAAPPAPPGIAEKHGLAEFGIAVLLFGAGVLLILLPRLRRAGPAAAPAASEPEHKTLAELASAGQLEAPAAEPVRPRAAAPAAAAPAEPPAAAIDRSIFRAYDIRGIVGQTLDAKIARLIGQAIGSVMHERNQRTIVVGRDGRLSSPEMAAALIEGLRKAGRDVVDIGEVPTPVVYFGTFHLRTGCGVSVTGSHNPPDYNGFKIVVDGETLAGDAIQNLYARIAENRLHKTEAQGQLANRDIKADYIERISGDIQIERKLKVVIDCGNGVAGAFAPELLESIGAQVEPLYCEVDGTFPHHHPDPSEPDNLTDLVRVVQRIGADIGLALDGDGDRLGVVTRGGEMIYPDRLLMLFATDVLERNPGACVIYDVKCTGNLATHILRHGGSPLMWKTGHSLIKSKMKETEAELAGEMSGHFFFRERWYGFDDGLYAAARLLEILAANPDEPEDVFAELPKGVSTPEIKIKVEEGEQYRFVEDFVAKAKFEGARLSTIDGLRADWPDGWGLVRASNTTPVLVLRFDAKDANALSRIQQLFREQLLAVNPSLGVPF